MASAAEQLASSMSWDALSKATELKNRIWFTLFVLVIYRLGTWVPVPGIDATVLSQVFQQHGGGILGNFDMFAGGALKRMSILALGIMPYISASIIMQLMGVASETVAAMKKEGEAGRKKINQWTRYLTVVLAAAQGYGIATGLENMVTAGGVSPVMEPGMFFRAVTVTTLVGGTMFLMWLGEQITQRGIGNGISLIIFAGIVAGIPAALAHTLELGKTGALPAFVIVGFLAMALAVIAGIVYVERAQRKVLIQYPKRQVSATRMTGGDTQHMPLKINTSGVIPPIFASALMGLPVTYAQMAGANMPEWIRPILAMFSRGNPVYMIAFSSLVVFFAFFYTTVVFNPDETADNLKKGGGFVPGIRPGKNTADYLRFVLNRLTAVGAAYLVLVTLLPELLMFKWGLPFYFGGTSLLIVVSVTLDTVTQVQSHLLAHQYEGLIKKSRLNNRSGRRR
ncbi:preprotein translocase subunit SecY [Oleispirillum naphthae]|uniref:preprotein translocase subunit SecY n=1 Tax=Oleispirillum naphthae TaxID=2838853 RepID=UPI003082330E